MARSGATAAGDEAHLACVINVSEGRERSVIGAIAGAGGTSVLDVHSDPDHHRSVLTLAGGDVEEAVQAVARRSVALIDLGGHGGVHPRLGALDVVPFVPLDAGGSPRFGNDDLGRAIEARDRFARWAGQVLALPCFLYGPERSLPTVRKEAFHGLDPQTGPASPHPSAGACAVGARGALIAYNVWLDSDDVAVARSIARAVRGPAVRALGLATGGVSQVSCNLVDPGAVGPAQIYDAVARLAGEAGTAVRQAELVGLAPADVVAAVPSGRWKELDLDPERTMEARLEKSGRL